MPHFFRHSFVLVLGALLLLPTPTQAQSRPDRLRIMTFNIRFDFENDGENRWEHRVEAVATMIEKSEASIVCIQEDKTHQIQDLTPRLPSYEFVGRGRFDSGAGERCSILYHREHLRLLDSGDFWLSETPERPGSLLGEDPYPRKVTWALLTTRAGRRFLVLNTHFTDGERSPLRTQSARIVAQWLTDRFARDRSRPRPIPIGVVVAGDFNEDAGSEPHRILTDSSTVPLRDVWEEVPPGGPGGTYNGFEGLPTRKRIDWLLVGGPLRVRRAAKFEQPIEGRYPSDHYPVYADIEIR